MRSSVEVSAQCRSSSTSSTGAAAARSVSSASVSSKTCSCEPALPVDLPRLPERTKGLEERLIRQLRADEIDRAPEQDLEPGGAGTSRELGGEPALADARFAGDEDGRTASGSRRIDRALELPELAYASDEYLARASHHSASIAHSHRLVRPVRPAEDTQVGAEDKALRPMRSRSSTATIRSIRRTRGDAT